MSFRKTLAITAFVAAALCVTAAQAAVHDQAMPSSATMTPRVPQPAGWPTILNSIVVGERIGPGVLYQRWTLTTDAGPLVVCLATVDLRNPSVALAVATHNGVIIGSGERLSSMADRLSAELGINADYFDINESGSPLNLVALDRRILHQPSRAANFVVDGQGMVQMGSLNWHAHVASAAGALRDISLVNDWSPSVELAILTPELGTRSAAGATEMVLAPAGAAGQYRVSRIDTNLTILDSLQPNELAVAARAAAAQSLAQDFHSGDLLTVTSVGDPVAMGIKLGIGGGPLL
ncbi:MAG TPA: hypothetical protein VGQ96_02500, partial [Candidatus Eremiobacteraceae bacterium]|nr:hypothetical protein [Candidatus Eremiobacteraceae bacterium]